VEAGEDARREEGGGELAIALRKTLRGGSDAPLRSLCVTGEAGVRGLPCRLHLGSGARAWLDVAPAALDVE
jgi:hypothetical protein